MAGLSTILRKAAVCAGALAATSVVATKIIDARQERKYREADALPCDPENPLPGQRPYPRDLPGHNMGFYERYVKRPQDFACALLAVIGLAPAMGVTALLVRAKLGSPVIFKQLRPGKDGRVFEIYKFRTMTDERDENGELLPDEDRLPLFGQHIRAASIDEVPELLNILKGDMAVVGPRPLLVQYLPLYNDSQARRHEVRPGLTGFAQTRGRNGLTWEEKFKEDTYYLNHIGPAEDWKTIFKTISTVVSGEGVSSGTSVTMEDFNGTN